MRYNIKAKNMSKKICEVFKSGYGNTIELKINGEPYKVVNNCKKKK